MKIPASELVLRMLNVLVFYNVDFTHAVLRAKSFLLYFIQQNKEQPTEVEEAFTPVTHVIFDLDGLLLDTEQLHYLAAQSVCAKFNKTYTWEMKVHTMGWLGKDAATYIVETLNLPISTEQYHKEVKKRHVALFPSAKLMPGAERLIRHFYRNKIPIALGTSSGQDNVELKMQNHMDLFRLFSHAVMGATDPEVTLGKPAPDIFLVCASKFKDKPTPEKVLVFEDSPSGVRAARVAGMQVVMVPLPGVPKEKTLDATLRLKSLNDFKPELFGLPPLPSGP